MLFSSFGRSLRHRNFRLFFAGQSVSLIGTWMQQGALQWLVLTKSETPTEAPLLLGLTGFSAQIPTFFLAAFAGVYVDRWNRRRLIVITQTLAMLQAIVVATLAYTGVIEIWHIIVLNLFLGCVHAFDIPARQAFLFDLVGASEDLSNAIALNSSMVNSARLIGPALAGIMLMQTSPAACFMLNALSYIGVLFALFAIRLPLAGATAARKHVLLGLLEGLRYAAASPPIRGLLLLITLVSFVGASYMVLTPIFAKEVLGGDELTMGLLQSAAGCGALLAAFLLAIRKSIVGLTEWIGFAPALLGLGLVGFSFSQFFWLSFVLVLINGFAVMTHMAASNTLLQSVVEEDKRGRIMSLYTMAFMGTIPLGSLMSGYLASKIGAPWMVRISGICCIIGAAVFFAHLRNLRRLIHPSNLESAGEKEAADINAVAPAVAPLPKQ